MADEIPEGEKRQRIEILERYLNLGTIRRKRRQKESGNRRLGTLQIMPHGSQGSRRFQKRDYLVNPQRSQEE